MKRIINTLLFMFAAITMTAQTSFVVADKNGNSQLVQSLIFQQQNADRFTWKSDGTATGDIKDLLFIARAQSELVAANSDDVTEMLEELSGTDVADAEGIAAALKSNSNVDDAYTVDGENLVFQKDESQFHTIYPMYDLKPAFSESYYLGAKQFLGKQYMKRKKAKGSSSQKVAIFNFFQGNSDYALQNQLVEMTATLFDTNNYDVTMYENSNFTVNNLENVINESKTNKNYKAIIIMSHGAMLTDASFSAEGLSVFMTGEECGQYDSCDKMYDSKSKKYFKTHSSAIYPDKDCILYLGSCYGAYWGEKHWKGDSNYDYSITSGIDPHEFDLPYAGLKTKGSNETSEVISYPDKDELTVVAWYGRNSIAQAHAAILFNKMIYNEQGLPDAIRSSFWIDPINWETHLFVSRSISPNHSLTLSGLQENKPDYRDNVSIRLTNVSRDMLVTNSGDLVKSPIDITGTIEGTVNGWVYCGLSRVTGDGKSGIYVNEKYPFYIYTQNSKKYFRAKFPIRFFAEGVYAFRVFDANLQEIRLQNPYYIVFSRNFSENYALPVLPEEDVSAPTILDDSGQPLEEITVAIGANKTFEIDGYSGHSFWALSLDEDIAKVAVNGTSLTVTGVSEGTTYIGIQDNQNKLIAVVKVTVTAGGDDPAETETITVNGVSFTMVAVEGGTYWMGSADDDGDAYSDERPRHEVTLSSFAIGQTEVTQELWEAVMGSNPSYFRGSSLPVEQVSWNDCQEFLTKLNALTGRQFRLPTEAEWEYAARGGQSSRGYKYSGGDNIDEVAWYDDNSGFATHAVGTKAANELGLYDMSGNVWEWCQDWYSSSYYSNSAQSNPQGPDSGSYRVCRGGSWDFIAWYCRVANRNYYTPSVRHDPLGLRLAL